MKVRTSKSRRVWARCLTGILCFCIVMSGSWPNGLQEQDKAYGAASDPSYKTEIDVESLGTQIDEAMAEQIGCKPGEVLAQSDWFLAGDSISDWLAMDLCLAGVKEDYSTYLKQLEAYVTERYAEDGTLDPVKATEYHRIALVVKALGKNPEAFGKHTDGSAVNLIEEGVYNYNGALDGQGFNGLIWALLALDSGDYQVPEGAAYTRESIIQSLLDGQLADGAFGLTDTADVDITSMTVQALAPYVNERDDVKQAVDKALTWLAGKIEDDCGIRYYDKKNPESVSQLLIALAALGIEPEADERFTRGGQTLLTQLESFQLEGGLYTHEKEAAEIDYLATEQSLLAHLAVNNLRNGLGPVYQLKQVTGTASSEGGLGMLLPVAVGAILVIILVAAVLSRKKGR